MPPPHDGNTPTSFTELMRLERITNDHDADATISDSFHSTALPFVPGGQLKRAPRVTFGGHVFAQSAWAAAQTVPSGMVLYNITGTFLLFGKADVPFTYRVQHVRDGRSSATRIVHATQNKAEGICFTCTCLFRTEQGTSLLRIQEDANLWPRYDVILCGRSPSDFNPIPGMDVPWYLDRLAQGQPNDESPGLEMTQPDMSAYNDHRHPLERRQLMFYRPLGDLPLDEPNLHLCAHLYASDRNGLYIVSRFLEVGEFWTQMGSLTHTVVFHNAIDDLLFRPSAKSDNQLTDSGSQPAGNDSPIDDHRGTGRWFCMEDRSDRADGGRMMLHRRVWSSDGLHVLTAMQDGMARFSRKPEPTTAESEAVRGRMREWKTRL